MRAIAVIGMQFGDEAKGKVVDVLAASSDVIGAIRYAGGNNAGHTVVIGGKTHKLHHIPATALRGKLAIVGHGTVVNPGVLLDEMAALGQFAHFVRVSPHAHVILPYHIHEDMLLESRKTSKVGTTGRGIGPCYADKANRISLQVRDMLDRDTLREKLSFLVPLKNALLQQVYGWDGSLSADEITGAYAAYGDRLRAHILEKEELPDGTYVLEGAQGTMLDPDLGTYPFVTSSFPSIGGALHGSGVARIDRVVGVTKAYATRVGEGPFPTEIEGSDANEIREKGKEFGTTTGRPRRVGWLDLPQLRYAVTRNGVTELAVTKMDVLAGMAHVRAGIGYERDGEIVRSISHASEMGTPVYQAFDGWPPFEASSFEGMPQQAKDYLAFIERFVGAPVRIVSFGADRTETMVREHAETRTV